MAKHGAQIVALDALPTEHLLPSPKRFRRGQPGTFRLVHSSLIQERLNAPAVFLVEQLARGQGFAEGQRHCDPDQHRAGEEVVLFTLSEAPVFREAERR